MNSYLTDIRPLPQNQRKIRTQDVLLEGDASQKFIRMKVNPPRFIGSIFDGDWGNPEEHPTPGIVRFLRRLEGTDGTVYDIVKQAGILYACRLPDES